MKWQDYQRFAPPERRGFLRVECSINISSLRDEEIPLAKAGREEPELAWSASSSGSAYTFVSRKLQQAIPKEAFLWFNCVNAVRYGKASDEIVAYAKDHEIDLICIGASGSDWSLGKLFGSNVDRVLRQAPCPVLVARPIRPTAQAQKT